MQLAPEVDGRLRRRVPTRRALRRDASNCPGLPCSGAALRLTPASAVTSLLAPFDVNHTSQALFASPFLPPSQLPALMSRIAALGRRPSRPATNPNASVGAGAAPTECADLTVSEILSAAQRAALDLCDMARVGAVAAAALPLVQATERFSCMRSHARAAAAALVLTLDDALIQELCRHVAAPFVALAPLLSIQLLTSLTLTSLAPLALFLHPKSRCSLNSSWRQAAPFLPSSRLVFDPPPTPHSVARGHFFGRAGCHRSHDWRSGPRPLHFRGTTQ